MCDKQFGKCGVVVNGAQGRSLLQAQRGTVRRGGGGRNADRLARQAPLAEEIARAQECYHRFLSFLGNDAQLDAAFLQVKNRLGARALGEDSLFSPIVLKRSRFSDQRQEIFRGERQLFFWSHKPSQLYVRVTRDKVLFPCPPWPAPQLILMGKPVA